MQRRAVPLLILALSFVAGFGLLQRGKPSRAQAGGQTSSPPQSPPPVGSYEIYAGLWRTDGPFDSTLRIRNQLLVAPLDVTPILYLADGTEYGLPAVHIATGGVAVVDINQALSSAPAEVTSHLSPFGSAELRYQYSSPGHVAASIQMLNIPQSLIFVTPFNGVDGTDDGQHTVEGLWWRRDPDVGGYISLANVTGNAIQVAVQAVGSQGTTEAGGTFALGPHTTQMLDLDELVSGLPGTENQAGGLRVQYSGAMNAVMVTGGLVNAKEGYSANLPFWFQDLPVSRRAGASTSGPAAITYASAGIRAGFPDPVTGFPEGTRFNPYFVLRNTTASALAVSPALNWMTVQGAPVSANLPALTLAPFATQPYDLKSGMANLGLGNFNGTINVSASFTGQAGDLIVSTGSVDQTGNYVFEVEPQGIGKADSKQAAYWSVANGFDTTFSLWNPTAEAQDLTVTFYYGDGSGSYALPVHLGGNASTTVDMTMLIESQQPDATGHVFPTTETAGSAIIRNAASGTVKTTTGTKLPAPITLVADVGTFNVQTATCSSSCPNCCGFMNFAITPSNFFCPVGQAVQCSLQATDCNGVRTSLSASWSSSDTSIMTVNSTGLATGVAPGTCTITAFASPPVAMGVTCPALCSFGSPSASTPANTLGVPTNFRQVGSGTDTGGGNLHFSYAWDSSTGNLADLSACSLYEVVTYPGTATPFIWPKPPWDGNSPNPTNTLATDPVPATLGTAVDDNGTKPFVKPYQAASFDATQNFKYHCTGLTDKVLLGPITISRSVATKLDGNFKYTISKSGATAIIDPLP